MFVRGFVSLWKGERIMHIEYDDFGWYYVEMVEGKPEKKEPEKPADNSDNCRFSSGLFRCGSFRIGPVNMVI